MWYFYVGSFLNLIFFYAMQLPFFICICFCVCFVIFAFFFAHAFELAIL